MELDDAKDTKETHVWVQFGETQLGLPESIWTYHSPVIKELIAEQRKRIEAKKETQSEKLIVTVPPTQAGSKYGEGKHNDDSHAFMKLEPLLRLIGTTKRGICNIRPLRSEKLEEALFWPLRCDKLEETNEHSEQNLKPDTELISLLKELFPFSWDSTKMPHDNWDRFNQSTLICATMTIATDLKMTQLMNLLGVYYAALTKIRLSSSSASSSASSGASATDNKNECAPMDICK